jgi:hypothetical protein
MADKYMSVQQFPSNVGLLHIEIIQTSGTPSSFDYDISDDAGEVVLSGFTKTLSEAKKCAKVALKNIGIQFHDEVRQSINTREEIGPQVDIPDL